MQTSRSPDNGPPNGGVRVAALYDVHGNLPALEAVLAEVETAGVDLIVLGGDLAWGPMPRETMDVLLPLAQQGRCVRGNADREVAARHGADAGLDPTTAAVNTWAADQLTREQRDFLGTLPDNVTLDVVGLGPVLFCHGSPRSDEECITTATPAERLREMLAGVDARTIVCGHTHAQFQRTIDDKLVVNAGSVGLPFGEPGAYWALLGPDVRLRRIDYDYQAAAQRFRDKGGPEADDFAEHALEPPPFETAAELFT